ncbi:exo-alpha-sialidase [Rubinisphaera italica]|uniref:BNR/Asp-box repeat protein n=1 Tax=Rubinisphaera italica TaxID=2527969 RepID=A0A5C5XED6_9PLAN|nr:exo-alpha-sialidase [Rubinisphaera italica]TWT60771.1 BNR/Asp-box repeat protein [Rubinisphaera italica]
MRFMIRIGLLASGALLLPWLAIASGADTIELDSKTHKRCVDVLRAGLHSDDFWPSIHAAEGLTLGGYGEEVIQFLQPKFNTETDDQRRCGIARELVRAGDRQYARIMLDILAGSETYGHVHAAESLYKVVEIGDGTAMRNAFEQDGNVSLKLMASGALGRCGNPQAMAYLRQSVRSDDPEVRRIAAWILGRIGARTDISTLKQQLPRSDEKLLRAYMQHSLAALGDPDGLEELAINLTDSDPAVRTYAATFAGDARAVEVADTLKHMLDDSHPDAAIRAAQSLLVLSSPAPADSAEDISQLLYRATESNPRYTEGSILALNSGELLFAVTEFRDTTSDFAKARIVSRRSSDGGHTWSEKSVLQENTGGMNVMSVTLRRLPNDSIAMFYLQKNSHSDLRLYIRVSNDEAASFGEPVLVTSNDGYHVVNNDRVTILKSGRLLAPAASTPDVQKVNHFVSHCYISDDNGVTWRNGQGQVDADRRGAMEPEVIELNDGRILMLIRTQLGYIGKSYSEDSGETWSEMTSLGVRGPEAPATVRRIPSTGDLLMIWNNCYSEGTDHGGKRTPLTAAVSRDEGQSWTVVGDLETDPQKTFSYTSLIFVRDRAVMSYWESGPASGQLSCRFRSLPIAWFYKDRE